MASALGRKWLVDSTSVVATKGLFSTISFDLVMADLLVCCWCLPSVEALQLQVLR